MSNPISRFFNSASVRCFFNRQISTKNIDRFYDSSSPPVFNIKNVSSRREITATVKLALKYNAEHQNQTDKSSYVSRFLSDYESHVKTLIANAEVGRKTKPKDASINELMVYLREKEINPVLLINKLNNKGDLGEFVSNAYIYSFDQASNVGQYTLNTGYLNDFIERENSSCFGCCKKKLKEQENQDKIVTNLDQGDDLAPAPHSSSAGGNTPNASLYSVDVHHPDYPDHSNDNDSDTESLDGLPKPEDALSDKKFEDLEKMECRKQQTNEAWDEAQKIASGFEISLKLGKILYESVDACVENKLPLKRIITKAMSLVEESPSSTSQSFSEESVISYIARVYVLRGVSLEFLASQLNELTAQQASQFRRAYAIKSGTDIDTDGASSGAVGRRESIIFVADDIQVPDNRGQAGQRGMLQASVKF